MEYVLRSSQTGAQSFFSFDEVVSCYSTGHFTGSEVVMQSVKNQYLNLKLFHCSVLFY